MYSHDDDAVTEADFQPYVSSASSPSSNEDAADASASNSFDLSDPLRDRVWDIARDLLSRQNEITVYDVVEASNITESPIRLRLGQLVNMGRLKHAPGAGRRPAYYFLPKDHLRSDELSTTASEDNSSDTCENAKEDEQTQLLELLKAKQARLQGELAMQQAQIELTKKDLEAVAWLLRQELKED